jgi:hypothetical protein
MVYAATVMEYAVSGCRFVMIISCGEGRSQHYWGWGWDQPCPHPFHDQHNQGGHRVQPGQTCTQLMRSPRDAHATYGSHGLMQPVLTSQPEGNREY